MSLADDEDLCDVCAAEICPRCGGCDCVGTPCQCLPPLVAQPSGVSRRGFLGLLLGTAAVAATSRIWSFPNAATHILAPKPKLVTFTRWERLSLPLTPLPEGIVPTGYSFVATRYVVTEKEFKAGLVSELHERRAEVYLRDGRSPLDMPYKAQYIDEPTQGIAARLPARQQA